MPINAADTAFLYSLLVRRALVLTGATACVKNPPSFAYTTLLA